MSDEFGIMLKFGLGSIYGGFGVSIFFLFCVTNGFVTKPDGSCSEML